VRSRPTSLPAARLRDEREGAEDSQKIFFSPPNPLAEEERLAGGAALKPAVGLPASGKIATPAAGLPASGKISTPAAGLPASGKIAT